jgi:hypothetical protein
MVLTRSDEVSGVGCTLAPGCAAVSDIPTSLSTLDKSGNRMRGSIAGWNLLRTRWFASTSRPPQEQTMPPLIRLILFHAANGFLIGAAAAVALVMLSPAAPDLSPLALWLKIYALGAPCALGSIGTALCLPRQD